MALLLYREPNEVRWIGTKPAHSGQSLGVWNSWNAVGWNALLPVHATATRYMTYLWVSMTDNVAQIVIVAVRDAVPALTQRLWLAESTVGYAAPYLTISFWPPIEIPPIWTIDVNLSAAQWVRAGIAGWFE